MTNWRRAVTVGISGCLVGPLSAGVDTYLALGDSLAFGYSTLLTTPQGFGDNGYVRRFADELGSRRGDRPEVLNFAVPGETVDEFFAGPNFGFLFNQNYFDDPTGGADFTQAELLAGALAEHVAGVRTVSNVTIQLGVNDLLSLADAPGFLGLPLSAQLAEVNATLASVTAGLGQILGDINAAAPDADVRVVGYYNPYAILPGDPLSPLAAVAVSPLNDALRSTAELNGAAFVDVFDLFVGREAELTRIQTIDTLGGANIHPTEAGYDVLAQAVIAVPGPAGLGVLAFAGVLASRRRRAPAGARV